MNFSTHTGVGRPSKFLVLVSITVIGLFWVSCIELDSVPFSSALGPSQFNQPLHHPFLCLVCFPDVTRETWSFLRCWKLGRPTSPGDSFLNSIDSTHCAPVVKCRAGLPYPFLHPSMTMLSKPCPNIYRRTQILSKLKLFIVFSILYCQPLSHTLWLLNATSTKFVLKGIYSREAEQVCV
jgi:hypothetical protein